MLVGWPVRHIIAVYHFLRVRLDLGRLEMLLLKLHALSAYLEPRESHMFLLS